MSCNNSSLKGCQKHVSEVLCWWLVVLGSVAVHSLRPSGVWQKSSPTPENTAKNRCDSQQLQTTEEQIYELGCFPMSKRSPGFILFQAFKWLAGIRFKPL
jgi:hypothetical protein